MNDLDRIRDDVKQLRSHLTVSVLVTLVLISISIILLADKMDADQKLIRETVQRSCGAAQ